MVPLKRKIGDKLVLDCAVWKMMIGIETCEGESGYSVCPVLVEILILGSLPFGSFSSNWEDNWEFFPMLI